MLIDVGGNVLKDILKVRLRMSEFGEAPVLVICERDIIIKNGYDIRYLWQRDYWPPETEFIYKKIKNDSIS